MMTLRSAVLTLLLCATTAGAQARSGMMNLDGASLRYDVSGSGPVVVLVHGWALTRDIWDDQVAALSPRYRVVRYDMRGFGQSTGDADRSLEPDDLRLLLDSLGIREPVHLVGLSRGAGVVADFAVRWPDRARSVVLYGIGPMPGFPLPPGVGLRPPFEDIARNHGVDSLKRFVTGGPLGWRPDGAPTPAMQRLDGIMVRYDARDLLHRRAESNRVALATLDEIARIRVPVLIVNGDHEMPMLVPVADTLARRMSHARKVVIPNAGHGAHFHQPAAFNRELLAFLNGAAVRP